MRRYLFVSILVAALAVSGIGGAQAKRGGDGGGGGGDNACPPSSPFPDQEPPSCGRPNPDDGGGDDGGDGGGTTGPCQGTLAQDIFVGTRDVPVANGVIQDPDGAGLVSTPVDNAVTGLTTERLGNQAGCAVSLTGL